VKRSIAKTKDESQIFGLSAAARFLNCAEGTVVNHTNAGRLACIRDTNGRRLFTLADLRKYKRTNRIGNQRVPPEHRTVQ
jgi:hypothetical protein